MLACRPLEKQGFVNGFSTRLGGVSPFPQNDLNLAGFDEDAPENITENRKRFLEMFTDQYKLATSWQVHGDAIRIIDKKVDLADSTAKADAMISDMPHVLVGVKTADCVPILIGEQKTRIFAAVHAGWRGTGAHIVAKTAAQMCRMFGAKESGLWCAIGPAASGRNYEVGPEVVSELRLSIPAIDGYLVPTQDGHALLDLQSANRDQLIDSGVSPDKIFIAPFCTMERTDLFFSYRIEKKKYGKTGRLLSVIGRA